MNKSQQKELSVIIDKLSNGDGIHKTIVPGLNVIKMSATNMLIPVVYDPSLCVIVQGKKQVMLEDEIYKYKPSEYLVVSVDLPVIGAVIEATEKEPYLCLQIDLDPRQISDLLIEAQQNIPAGSTTGRGVFVGKVDESLSDCTLRLARLLNTPRDIALLAPMIMREIHYRLLNGEYGSIIAQLGLKGSNMHSISKVIRNIKSNFDKPMMVEDMADLAGMSLSSFHVHFKEVTAMSPLQYQKRLRLMEARRLMIADNMDATNTAYKVGYESPSQFSREYARMFGMPPMRDTNLFRASEGY